MITTHIRIVKSIFIILILLLSWNTFPQSKLQKWGKEEVPYTLPVNSEKRNYSFEGENIPEVFTKTFINAYWFFISDVDGDNCPFYPSCSVFFVQSVKETNIFQGTLMFTDRFTRDMNFINRNAKYPLHSSGKYYDPPLLYELNQTSFSNSSLPRD